MGVCVLCEINNPHMRRLLQSQLQEKSSYVQALESQLSQRYSSLRMSGVCFVLEETIPLIFVVITQANVDRFSKFFN